MYDLILSRGFIYDGLGNPGVTNDIGIIGDRITAIDDLRGESCRERINLQGLSVAPGFIDMHSHSDVNYFINPEAECKIRQGVTTEVVGNCGGSGAPLYGEFRKARKKEWDSLGIKIKWRTFKQYKNLLQKSGVAVNVVPIVGHGNIRGAVKGYSTSPVTKKEMLQMQTMLAQAMEEGAFGFSTGLIYIPGMYADTKEIIEFAKIVVEFGGIYTTHMRSEGDRLLESLKESIEIAEKSGIRLQISHLKTSGRKNWHKLHEVFTVIEKAIANGVKITCDRYPYIASNTDLDTLLPNWFHEMSYKERKNWIEHRKEEVMDVLRKILDYTWPQRTLIGKVDAVSNFRHKQGIHFLKQKVKKVRHSEYKWTEGKMVHDIAKRLKEKPEKVVVDLLQKADFQVQAMFFNMREENLREILKKPYVMIGSDSSLRAMKGPLRSGHPHPRVFGTFPRVLARYTGKGVLSSVPEAVYKMTGLPAKTLGLRDRGRIEQGAYADIVIFNPKTIKDKATYEKPFQYPEGIEYVIVNGEIVLNKGIFTRSLPGRVLSGGQTSALRIP